MQHFGAGGVLLEYHDGLNDDLGEGLREKRA
jgi:hypothetical protein